VCVVPGPAQACDCIRCGLREVVDDALPSGTLRPGAHVVALMLENGVPTIWTRGRDCRRFPRIEVRDPFA
jgi:hypothetical protein